MYQCTKKLYIHFVFKPITFFFNSLSKLGTKHQQAMERLKLVLQYFQSNSESISNGICAILALISVKLYTSFDFNCPCMPQYNKMYALGVMFIPPIILFLLGVLVNRHTGVMMEEWVRPPGKRSKNPAVIRYLFTAMIQRALLAPVVWILVTLLDGKCFVCAFSMNVDPKYFSGMPNNTGLDLQKLMAKVPCKEDIIFRNNTFRKAVSRYVRCYSQLVACSSHASTTQPSCRPGTGATIWTSSRSSLMRHACYMRENLPENVWFSSLRVCKMT
ncbi:calcium homeostasis modulator protein 3 isoform X3 [Denticeps clupeoides]|uniref:calcium homeostasis modulator protein 3 isoform X3 n=1 Tax=Denticeps clupeoides TaxID=299321 RepID=UPI0010A457D1|nr:calcium homeostasis modulator protein 3 isoform X3 [Denticeps clupeoides]